MTVVLEIVSNLLLFNPPAFESPQKRSAFQITPPQLNEECHKESRGEGILDLPVSEKGDIPGTSSWQTGFRREEGGIHNVSSSDKLKH